MKNNKLLAAGLMAGATLGASNSFALEQYFNTPGTRAMGMGGAFIATVGDSTAMWYNPAGLAKTSGMDITLEVGDVIERLSTPEVNATCTPTCGDIYDTDSNIKYLAFSSSGMGFAYFAPYKFYNTAVFNVSGGSSGQFVDIETEYTEFKWGMGGDFNENVRWGFTLDMLSRDADLSGGGADDNLSELEFGFSLGIQGDLPLEGILPKGHKLSYGAIYRSGTDSEVEDDVTFDAVKGVPGRPQALNYGLGYSAPLPTVGGVPMFLTANLEFDNLEYEDILNGVSGGGGNTNAESNLEEDRVAWGFEVQLFPSFLEDKKGSLFVRFGMSETEVDAVDNQAATFINDIESTTYGLGLKLGSWVFDYAREARDLQVNPFFVNLRDQEVDLDTFSISYAF